MIERSLATVLFTDIVGSTERAAAIGDDRWRELLDRHHALVRRWLRRFGGREVKTAGDGFLVVFDSPASALTCADAIRNAVGELDLGIRCGLHIGEVEKKDGDVGGLAVHIGARVAALAGRGEVLVSSTVRDAEVGSGFTFEDRGRHELKGVPGEWRVYALTGVPEEVRAALLEAGLRPMEREGSWSRLASSRLVRTALIYAAASVLVLVMTHFFIERLGLPQWAMPAAAILLLVGLVVVGATAWVQSKPSTRARAAAGEVPQPHALDLGGLAQALRRGELPHLTWARAVVGGVFAFSLLFGLAGLYVVIKDRGKSFSPSEAVAESAGPGIAVLPFTVQGAEDIWREGMVDLLATNLDGAAGLRGIDSRTVLARWREVVGQEGSADLATALEVGRLAGASYILLGSVVASGSDVRLTAEVYDVRDGGKLGQGQVVGAPDSVFTLVDRLSIEVLRAILQGREADLPGVNLARVTTSSLPALKAFLEGEVLFRRGDFKEAIPAYERAVEADSTFALANYRLATAYGWAESIVSDLGKLADERAVRYADRLPEHEEVLVRAAASLGRGTLDGLEPVERAVRRHPDDPEAWYLLGEYYFHLGNVVLVPAEKAEEAFARAVELDPRFLPAYIHRLDYAFLMADSARAAALIDSIAAVVPASDDEFRPGRVLYDLAFGDPAAKERAWSTLDSLSPNLVAMGLQDFRHPRFRDIEARVYRLALEKDPGRVSASIQIANNLFSRGKRSEALESVDAPGLPPPARSALLYFFDLQGLELPVERLDEELALATVVEGDGVGPAVDLFFAGAWAAERGREADRAAARGRLRDMAGRLRVQGDSTAASFADGAGRALDGLFAWQRGNHEQAEEFLEEARRTATGHTGEQFVNATIRWWLAELMIEMDRPHDAERYLASLWWNTPLAERRLGDVYMEMEEFGKARERYERFLMAWDDPDPELRPIAEEVRQKVVSLRPLRRE